MPQTDDELMARVKQKDSRAFGELYDRHGSAVFGYCMRALSGNRSLAEDISQSVWMSVVRYAEGYQPRGQFRAWLMTITRNESIRQATSGLPRGELDVEAEVAGDFDLEQSLVEAHDTERVKRAVEALPDAQRLPLLLWLEADSSYEEIGKKLGIGAGAVRGLLHRARAALKKALEKR